MDLHLRDRVYVVTGGSRGLGFAAADALIAEGARVVVSSHGKGSAAAAADRARATQTAVANALNAAAERIEKTTQVLNRTIGGGIAIG